ncbi:hypothetical protein C8Q78DRAFT_999181 [Trametes maxima]|nr:hypothetical protein C8Q78DRAFT_999181 [Trametes maxima]
MSEQAAILVQKAAEELRVLAEFAKYEDQSEAEVIVRLEHWKQRASETLSVLRENLRSQEALSSQTKALVVYSTAPFDGDGAWITDSSRGTAQDILTSLGTPEIDVLERILRDFVKPVFILNPHPHINAETGRTLHRSAGGALGDLDYLEGQVWKTHPELFNVLHWCLRQANGQAIERLWHLFVPPTLTYLDDFQAEYKLQGAHLVSQLLRVAPADLLRRTGMDVLLSTSLKICMTFLHNRETPDLIRAVVPVYIQLTTATTNEGSVQRFDQLCSLLGDSIIGNIWIYASREPETIQASIDVIPDIVEVLDVGTVRYLKALVPQLVFPLIPAPENDASNAQRFSSLRALRCVVQACVQRMHGWRGMILEALLKCWVNAVENHTNDNEIGSLKEDIRGTVAFLVTKWRPVAPDIDRELCGVLSLDPGLFGSLLTPILVIKAPTRSERTSEWHPPSGAEVYSASPKIVD